MKTLRRLAPFPWKRLSRLPADAARLSPSPSPALASTFTETAGRLARRLQLPAPRVEFHHQEVIAREQLRDRLPGQWRFALLLEPLSGRQGFLALDALLCSTLAASLRPETARLRGWWGQPLGINGLAGLAAALVLEELENFRHCFDFSLWRYGGLVPSAGELGRGTPAGRLFYAGWWKIAWPEQTAFVGWLEPENSRPAAAGREHPSGWLSACGDLLVCGRLELGRVALQADALASLRHGDVLLLDDSQPASLSFDEARFTLGRHERGFEILTVEQIPGGMDMSEINISTVRENRLGPEQLSRLPVEVRVEAGRVRLKLEQVLTLKAGDVLAISEKVLGPVEVIAGERLIARGELVEVEGRRGVRLLEVLLEWEDGRARQA